MKPTERQKIRLRTSTDGIYPLGNECWSEIEPFMYIKELETNEYFSKEGQYVKDLGFVIGGILRIYYLNDKGEEWNKHFLLKNDFVASGISPEKKSITRIQALVKTVILCIPFAELIKISDKHRAVNLFLQKLAFEYLEKKQTREIRLLSENAMSNYLWFRSTYPGLENKIRHYHVASYLGITPTQLSRLRKKLEKNNARQHL